MGFYGAKFVEKCYFLMYNDLYMSTQKEVTMFIVGDPVVYPQQGVGIVRSIQERSIRGKKLMYYNIYMENSEMTILVPLERAKEIGLRPIVGKSEALGAIEKISSKYEPTPVDWKLRFQQNLDLLKQGSIVSIVKVVQSLYHRSKVKELPVQERKLYENALRLLIDETSFALDKDADTVKALILSKLEK